MASTKDIGDTVQYEVHSYEQGMIIERVGQRIRVLRPNGRMFWTTTRSVRVIYGRPNELVHDPSIDGDNT